MKYVSTNLPQLIKSLDISDSFAYMDKTKQCPNGNENKNNNDNGGL